MSKPTARNRPAVPPRPGRKRPQVPPYKGAAARRARATSRVPPRRHRARWSVATAVLAAVVSAVVTVTLSGHHRGSPSRGAAVGDRAPNGSFSTVSGATESVSAFRGQPTLLWFVTTWCSSCQAGTQAMASAIDSFDMDHVRVVELENFEDLGQSGPSIATFGHALAGSSYSNPDWTWGVASKALTATYNPRGYLDIYYLLNSSGKIVDVSSSPAATMPDLLAKAAALRTSPTSSATPSAGPAEVPAPATVVRAATSVPPSVSEAVGLPPSVTAPELLPDQPPLTLYGKPAVIYVGAEYCPFCAAERWAAVVALSRFGTFSGLGETRSSTTDVYPGTVTFSFYGAKYTSPYLTFDPTETNTDQPSPQGGYTPLQPLTGIAKKTFEKYDSTPFVPEQDAGSIPFYDFGNRVLVVGASYSPQVLQGLSASQIAKDLANPASPAGQAIVGTANYLTAAICSVTNGQPASVCRKPYVLAAARALKLPHQPR